MTSWMIEYEGDRFEKFFLSLSQYEQAVLIAAVEHVLAVHGIDICSGEWGKSLGDGLYEFRVRKSLGAILKTAGVALSAASVRALDLICVRAHTEETEEEP